MNDYLSVFRNKSGENQVMEAYNVFMKSWPVEYEDLYIPTNLGITHIIASGSKTAPPVFLIHAFYASAASWFHNVESLSRHFRVYNVDIIGDPNKSRPYKPIRQLSSFVEWFHDVMNQLQVDQADFVGNSVGAYHVANFALNAPHRVRRMILIGPAATFNKMPGFYFNTFPGGMTGWTFLVKHAVRWIEHDSALDPKFRRLFYLIMKYGKSANQVFPAVLTDEQLKSISTPTLVIYGEKEVIYDYNLAAVRAERLMQNVGIEIIPGANHLTAASVPGLTNKALLAFLSG